MSNCKHYIAAQPYTNVDYEQGIYDEEAIKRLQEYPFWYECLNCVDAVYKRTTPYVLFNFCPICGEPINWRSIRNRMKTYKKKHPKPSYEEYLKELKETKGETDE